MQREVLPYEIFYGYDSNSKAEVKLNYTNDVNYSVSFTEAENEIKVKEGSIIAEGQLHSYLEIDGDITYLVAYSNKTNHFYYKDFGEEIDEYINNADMFSSTIKKNDLTTALDKKLGKIKIKQKIEVDLNKRMTDIYKDEFDYEFIPTQENYNNKKIALTHSNNRIFSDFHGDGMQRALLFLSTIELSADTAVFIEEIEMFQHPKALKRLAKHLVDLAKKNRVQLFITTHNYDAFVGLALDSCGLNTTKEQKELFRSYIVTNEDGIVDAKVEYDPSKIANELHFND